MILAVELQPKKLKERNLKQFRLSEGIQILAYQILVATTKWATKPHVGSEENLPDERGKFF